MSFNNYLITGGAGFIGSNYANRLLNAGKKVTIFDNLSRKGTEKNLAWLKENEYAKNLNFVQGDVRRSEEISAAAENQEVVVHLAAQVAVTTSVTDPRFDFEVNAFGTFNVLEAARNNRKKPVFLYASTNKVYGGLEDLEIQEMPTRYKFRNLENGVSEKRVLDFHSPYGCSKGAGDQYVRDYARIYEMPTVVFRQSCIYGPRQFGVEDQGWVAWFIIASIINRELKIYGDGKQVRDLLFVEDLLDAYDCAIENHALHAGKVFNIGGGFENAISIWSEFSEILQENANKRIRVEMLDWRPGDQKVYISDIRKAQIELNWNPKVNVKNGINRLFQWARENKKIFESE